jgi:hypothetical protein
MPIVMRELRSNDPITSLLKSFGYNDVRLPGANIQPLQVLSQNSWYASYFQHMKDEIVNLHSSPMDLTKSVVKLRIG